MYSVPSLQPSTAGVQPNHNVHFQPINLAPKSLVQPSNQGIFNPLLNLVDDSPRPPSSSSSSSIPCGHKDQPRQTTVWYTSIPQSPAGQPQAPMDPQFSNPNNQCLHCGGDHRSAIRPTWSQHQPTPSTSSCVSSAGKPHINMSPQQGTKNSQSTTCSMTSTLLVNNPARTPRHNTGNNIPQVSPQVNPNVPQQHNPCMPNAIPPTQIPNQFPPPPYFPIPFPLPPVTPSNVSAASSAPASDLSAAISLMTNAVNQGNSNTTAITDALQRTTTQFVDALQQTIQMGVDA